MMGRKVTYSKQRIARLRSRNGWTLRELADELGVSKSTIHRWETGEYDIPRIIAPALIELEKRAKASA